MIISAVIPFIFLNKDGLRSIGLRKSNSTLSLLLSFGLGLLYAFILFGIGYMLYGTTIENWYIYIGKSYNIPDGITSADKLIMFLIMSVTGMIFSPIGEEFYFRGIVHECFKNSLGENKASKVDSLAFSLTHIAHFGVIFINNQMKIIWIPMILWIVSMYFASRLFFYCKEKSNSIWGAVLCHSGFNLMMIYCIFYLLYS
ncbi:CPBP family intramembrane glutamic endopeptidase [Sphingobacterium cellulitidis]|uniref:CPBP family intramembrane glutamic endopeptidase n=1 Tax=Sphingobacterium cellulitidis TaxID=1768011 RepID=UPI00296E5308